MQFSKTMEAIVTVVSDINDNTPADIGISVEDLGNGMVDIDKTNADGDVVRLIHGDEARALAYITGYRDALGLAGVLRYYAPRSDMSLDDFLDAATPAP